MPTITTKNVSKVAPAFFCEKCDYGCSKKSVFDKHLLTKKHNTTKSYNILHDDFTCECGKSYPYRASLYNHKRTCQAKLPKLQKNCSESDIDMKNLVENGVNKNKELIYAINEQLKTIQYMISLLE
jgi:hypothetical protein